MNTSLNNYIPLVEFIGKACGADFEVILHDTENPEHSIIAIKNGHLSNRKIGGLMTDLAMRIVHEEEYRTRILSQDTKEDCKRQAIHLFHLFHKRRRSADRHALHKLRPFRCHHPGGPNQKGLMESFTSFPERNRLHRDVGHLLSTLSRPSSMRPSLRCLYNRQDLRRKKRRPSSLHSKTKACLTQREQLLRSPENWEFPNRQFTAI